MEEVKEEGKKVEGDEMEVEEKEEYSGRMWRRREGEGGGRHSSTAA